ncbi:hypothetical protein CERSUDRAFT_110225 [Gelatoporia subvermispora B]|uniref:Chalcone isomerase domain-containing protein n=1 Tax=Ceriporiopsis subvermispora (strain B) TaxID=914234 RepID=M2RB33_CERS8|nr:hypothetical protein CERSUDRAFT_110225 [Gelatoporia subvermispora B]
MSGIFQGRATSLLSRWQRNIHPVARRLYSGRPAASAKPRRATASLLLAGAGLFSAAVILNSTVHLDAEPKLAAPKPAEEDVVVDPATSIAFPKTMRIPSKAPLPTFSLVGVGVRTVSFLGIKVYSVGFYADLSNPNINVSQDAPVEEKIDAIICNSACVMRIVPTRSTSYGHLRDGFMRALQARLLQTKLNNPLTPDDELLVQSALRKFKTIFPNTPLAKHEPLEVLVVAPPKDPKQDRTLVIRDMGTVQNNWLAREFLAAYFDGSGISPALKQSVAENLKDFGN